LEYLIDINNLNFKYDDKNIFDNFTLKIKKGQWLSVIGPNCSGKSTLVKLLVGILENNNSIKVDGILLTKDKIMEIRRRIGVIFQNPDNYFVGETVRDELAFTLENLCVNVTEMHTRIMRVSRALKINHLLELDPRSLSGGEKQKVALASILVIRPKIIVLDEALAMVDSIGKKEILNILKELNEDQKITIINITHNLEETLYGDKIVVIDKGIKLMEGKTLDVLKKDNILSKLGLELPFMVDLSLKLQFYELINDIKLDMDDLVVSLWK
jgi:energy-coupling factor transport system ATP-binding protein